MTRLLTLLAILLTPATALAQTADTPPPELFVLLLDAWGAWSVVAGLVALIAIQVWRRYKPQVWASLHPAVKRLLPPLVSALTTGAVALATGADWAAAGKVFAVQWLTLAWAADGLGALTGVGQTLVEVERRDRAERSRWGSKLPPVSLIVLLAALALPGCAVMRPAVNAVDSVCAAGLADHPAVAALAGAKGWPLEQTASWLCGFPAVYNAWDLALTSRTDPAEAAVRAARERGLL